MTIKKNTIDNPRIVLEWHGPVRPFKKRDKSFYQTTAAILFLLIIILFFIREWLIIGVVLAVVFLVYVLAAVPPEEIVYKLSKKGVWIDDTFYEFERMTHFWFETHLENTILVLLAPGRRNPRIILVIPPEKKGEIQEFLQTHLEYKKKPIWTFTDSLGNWLRRAIPLEEDTHMSAK